MILLLKLVIFSLFDCLLYLIDNYIWQVYDLYDGQNFLALN